MVSGVWLGSTRAAVHIGRDPQLHGFFTCSVYKMVRESVRSATARSITTEHFDVCVKIATIGESEL